MARAFQEALGPEVKVYSQANLVAESLADYLQRRPQFLHLGRQYVAVVGVKRGATKLCRHRC